MTWEMDLKIIDWALLPLRSVRNGRPQFFRYETLFLAARRSGSFPEQSNKMNERSATWRQTIRLSIFITESRLKNRTTTEVTKKVRSLK